MFEAAGKFDAFPWGWTVIFKFSKGRIPSSVGLWQS